MARAIDGEELLGIERLLDTDVVRKNETASWLLDQVLHDIQAMPTLTPPNEPLTLEGLLRMDGAPVWLDVAGGMWALVDALDGCLWLDRGGSIDIAKFVGKAYRRPPEGEA